MSRPYQMAYRPRRPSLAHELAEILLGAFVLAFAMSVGYPLIVLAFVLAGAQ
jgi:hypothetical protein